MRLLAAHLPGQRAACGFPRCALPPPMPCPPAAVILALRDIQAGEEVTLSYIGARAAAPASKPCARWPAPALHSRLTAAAPGMRCFPGQMRRHPWRSGGSSWLTTASGAPATSARLRSWRRRCSWSRQDREERRGEHRRAAPGGLRGMLPARRSHAVCWRRLGLPSAQCGAWNVFARCKVGKLVEAEDKDTEQISGNETWEKQGTTSRVQLRRVQCSSAGSRSRVGFRLFSGSHAGVGKPARLRRPGRKIGSARNRLPTPGHPRAAQLLGRGGWARRQLTQSPWGRPQAPPPCCRRRRRRWWGCAPSARPS